MESYRFNYKNKHKKNLNKELLEQNNIQYGLYEEKIRNIKERPISAKSRTSNKSDGFKEEIL